MLIKKNLFVLLIIFVISLFSACYKTDVKKTENMDVDISKAITQKPISEADLAKITGAESKPADVEDAKAMEELILFLKNDVKPSDFIALLNKHISKLSKENASKMVLKLEGIQQKYLSKFEVKFYEEKAGNNIQSNLEKVYEPDIENKQLSNITDAQVKALLVETRDSGYRIDIAEGSFYPLISYQKYKQYEPYLTPDIKDYVELMAVESNIVSTEDAALVISWDALIDRALKQEKFLKAYPNSSVNKVVDKLFKNYASTVFCGANNTPLFNYQTNMMDKEAQAAYTKVLKSNIKTPLIDNMTSFMSELQKNEFKLVGSAVNKRKSILEIYNY